MMEWTDRHCRYFHRLMTKRAALFTEMVTAPAIIHGDRARLLGFDAAEHPIVCQLGGSDPAQLAEAARIVEGFGYDRIDLNCGCPSDRVRSGRFGASLMDEPDLVADCVAAMRGAVSLPISVKCRIGIDDAEPREMLPAFLEEVVAAGVASLTIHARKAWLQGLSPRENRTVPPLDYDIVFDMKRRWATMPIAINGGIADIDQSVALLEPRDGVALDGVMLGRAAYETPAILGQVDRRIFGETVEDADPFAVVEAMEPYIARHLEEPGAKLNQVVRHMLGLFAGRPGARGWRRILTVKSISPDAGLEVLREALDAVRRPASAERTSADRATA